MLTNPTLKSQVDALWNRFWSGGISNPLTAIEQMSYLIFLKRLEDMDNARAAAAKRRKNDFKSVFTGKMDVGGRKIDKEKCRWSYWSQLPGDEMLRHVRDTVFEFLRNLGSETSSFTQHMEDAMFSIPKASLLQEAVKIIDDMHISEQNIDVQGDLYEYLLGQLSTAGKNGQFRTPRHIIRMMTKLIDPKIGERICDPAAGTAGFLVSAYEHILESNTSTDILTYDDEGKAHNLIGDKITNPKLHEFLKSRALTGFDFDATMVRMGAMNLMLHGVDNPNFKYADALSKQFSEKQCYDVILKGGITDKVWFYDMGADGFSLDDKRQTISDNDIPDIIKKFPDRKAGKNVVLVKADEIRKNKYDLSISRYKAVEHISIEYEKPEKIMNKILELEEDIVGIVKKIKKGL